MQKTIIVNERQAKMLMGGKALIKEYYDIINTNKDSHLLGNLSVYLYGEDRPNFTPHFHLYTKAAELEYSLIDLSCVNSKANNGIKVPLPDKINKWFNEQSTHKKSMAGETNIMFMFRLWDEKNPSSTLYQYLVKHPDKKPNAYLAEYIKRNCNNKPQLKNNSHINAKRKR